MANSRQTITLPGSGSRFIADKLLTETGDQILLESGQGFLGVEEGGVFAVQSTAIDGLSDYAFTLQLLGGFTVVADVNSQQDIVLADPNQNIRMDADISNSKQTIRLTR